MPKKLFKTHCYICNKPITVSTKKPIHNIYSCNNCIPQNSPVRNNIDETYDTEIEKMGIKSSFYMEITGIKIKM